MARPKKISDLNKRFNNRRSKSRDDTYGSRRLRKKILIITNGKETEKGYFERFEERTPPGTLDIDTKYVNGDPEILVNYAIKRWERRSHDYIAVVFDKDDFQNYRVPIARMKASAKRAKKERAEENKKERRKNNKEKRKQAIEGNNGDISSSSEDQELIFVAYSNECFELWMLLHFQDIERHYGRQELFNLLQDKVREIQGNRNYQHKNDDFPYDILYDPGDEQKAIRRAEKLLKLAKKQDPRNPWNVNPSTEVHLLVKKLLEFTNQKK